MATTTRQLDVSTLEWWTPREVGNKHGYDDSTIRRWCETGKIKAAKMPGGTWRIHVSVVESLGSAGLPRPTRRGQMPAEFADATNYFDESPSPKARVRT